MSTEQNINIGGGGLSSSVTGSQRVPGSATHETAKSGAYDVDRVIWGNDKIPKYGSASKEVIENVIAKHSEVYENLDRCV